MRTKIFLVFLLAAFMSGCVPFIDRYYDPDGSGVRLVKRGCGDTGGPLRGSTYEAEGISIHVASEQRADSDGKAMWVGVIVFDPKKDVEVRLQGAYIKFETTGGAVMQLPIEHLHNVATGEFSTLSKFVGYTVATFSLPTLTSDSFELVLPNITVSGKTISVPPYHFRKVSLPSIASFNC